MPLGDLRRRCCGAPGSGPRAALSSAFEKEKFGLQARRVLFFVLHVCAFPCSLSAVRLSHAAWSGGSKKLPRVSCKRAESQKQSRLNEETRLSRTLSNSPPSCLFFFSLSLSLSLSPSLSLERGGPRTVGECPCLLSELSSPEFSNF